LQKRVRVIRVSFPWKRESSVRAILLIPAFARMTTTPSPRPSPDQRERERETPMTHNGWQIILSTVILSIWLLCSFQGFLLLQKRGWALGVNLFLGLFGPIICLLYLPLLLRKISLRLLFAILGACSIQILAVYGSFNIVAKTLGLHEDGAIFFCMQLFWFFCIVSGLFLSLLLKRISLSAVWIVSISTSLVGLFKVDFLWNNFFFGASIAYFSVTMYVMWAGIFFALLFGACCGFLFFGEGRWNASFSYETWISRRFLMAKRSSHMVSLITILSIFAVVMACSGMIIVMSVMNGFSNELRMKILGAHAHLVVHKYGQDFSEYKSVLQKTEKLPQILGASPFVLSEVMISANDNITGAVIKGIDNERVKSVGMLKQNLIEGSLEQLTRLSDSAGIIIGQEMARNLNLHLGDTLNVVNPIGELGPTGPIPKAKPFVVVGIFYSGMYEYDAKSAYIDLQQAQQFFNLKQSVTGIEYKVDDIYKANAIGMQITRLIGGYPYHAKDWIQMNKPFFSALRMEKIAMNIILVTLICMASLLVLVTLIMVVLEKGKDIAILKSIGASDVSIMKIFVSYGLTIGVIGSLVGVGLGVFLCLLIPSLGIQLDPQVYYFSAIPIMLNWVEIAYVALSVLFVSFFATIPPALFAAGLKPVEGLRYE